MFKIKQQLRRLYAVTAISSLQIAGASWVALLAARGFSLTEIGFAEGVFHFVSFLFEVPSGVIGPPGGLWGRPCPGAGGPSAGAGAAGAGTGSHRRFRRRAHPPRSAGERRLHPPQPEGAAADALQRRCGRRGHHAALSAAGAAARSGPARRVAGARAVRSVFERHAGRPGRKVCRRPWLSLTGAFLAGMLDNLLDVRSDVVLNEMVPSAQRATLVSVSSLTFSLVMLAAAPLMGALFGAL